MISELTYNNPPVTCDKCGCNIIDLYRDYRLCQKCRMEDIDDNYDKMRTIDQERVGLWDDGDDDNDDN